MTNSTEIPKGAKLLDEIIEYPTLDEYMDRDPREFTEAHYRGLIKLLRKQRTEIQRR